VDLQADAAGMRHTLDTFRSMLPNAWVEEEAEAILSRWAEACADV
jgi:hypothetical protein